MPEKGKVPEENGLYWCVGEHSSPFGKRKYLALVEVTGVAPCRMVVQHNVRLRPAYRSAEAAPAIIDHRTLVFVEKIDLPTNVEELLK